MRGSNDVAIGYDEGSVMIKVSQILNYVTTTTTSFVIFPVAMVSIARQGGAGNEYGQQWEDSVG